MKIQIIQHKSYTADLWKRWRAIKEGGDDLIKDFLYQRNKEQTTEFNLRKKLAYDPGDAAAAVKDVTDALAIRITTEVNRNLFNKDTSGIFSGLMGGVDLNGSTMGGFIAREILPELCFMKRIGIFVDAPIRKGPTKADITPVDHPYLTIYKAENIINYTYKGTELISLLLRENRPKYDPDTQLFIEEITQYKLIRKQNNQIVITYHDENGYQIDKETGGKNDSAQLILDLPNIPFTLFELKHSLLRNIDKMQIALMNIESSDLKWLWRGNVPIFIRQQTKYSPGRIFRGDAIEGEDNEDVGETHEPTLKFGDAEGIEYPGEPPSFIAPPSDPIKVSIEKQEQIRRIIRYNLSLTLQDIQMESAQSKRYDERGMEAGLAAIGRILEVGENKILLFWSQYTGISAPGTITYPLKYELLSEETIRKSVEDLINIATKFPSVKAQKAILTQAYTLLEGHKLDPKDIQEHINEIVQAKSTVSDPKTLISLVDAGMIPISITTELLGMPPNTQTVIEEEHARRLARIQEAQTKKDIINPAARGNPDLSVTPVQDAKREKNEQ